MIEKRTGKLIEEFKNIVSLEDFDRTDSKKRQVLCSFIVVGRTLNTFSYRLQYFQGGAGNPKPAAPKRFKQDIDVEEIRAACEAGKVFIYDAV